MIPSNRIGRKVGRSGEEDIHLCLVCNREKLYINHGSGVGFCFRCGQSVQVDIAYNRRSSGDSRELPPTFPLTQRDERSLAVRAIAFLGARACVSLQWGTSQTRPAIPLHLGGVHTVGYTVYHGEGADPKYQTIGKRGLHRSNLPLKAPLLLLEGFFDYLSVVQCDVDEHAVAVYTCGNQITDAQIAELVSWNPQRILIGFDRDLPSVAYKAKHRLEGICPRVDLLPPPLGKDWDESLQLDPESLHNALTNAEA